MIGKFRILYLIFNGTGAIVNGKKVVNKFMYCILAIFFGGLGLHKFYCRKKEIGLLYLALFWTGIPWAISIIDFIIALTKKADSNGNILI